ncbi:hypothetical protein BC629DRAFT_43367 [Irpex lacteus]|nr:hypothetical protein BC629DRAFT_43367 [Irpex lacteus]
MGQSGSSKPEAAKPPVASNGPKVFLYHQIWRTLLHGDNDPSHKRPALPIELVRLISRFAGLCIPDHTRTFICEKEVSVRSGGPFETKLWFYTSPFDEYALKHALRLEKAKSESDGWRLSHKNKGAVNEPQDLKGPVVDIDDKMWEGFVEGSVLAVRVCARFPMWTNHARRAEIKFWRWFEPVIDL